MAALGAVQEGLRQMSVRPGTRATSLADRGRRYAQRYGSRAVDLTIRHTWTRAEVPSRPAETALHTPGMNLYDVSVPHLAKSLTNLERWIDKAVEHASTRSFDANNLLAARLAPDQITLARQVMSLCDHAKFIVGRAIGKEVPKHEDNQNTWDELHMRIRAVRDWVSEAKPVDFEGAETRVVTLSFFNGKVLSGKDYVLEFGLPNFDFHLVTAYAILRHNGVDIGKRDFIGGLPLHDPA